MYQIVFNSPWLAAIALIVAAMLLFTSLHIIQKWLSQNLFKSLTFRKILLVLKYVFFIFGLQSIVLFIFNRSNFVDNTLIQPYLDFAFLNISISKWINFFLITLTLFIISLFVYKNIEQAKKRNTQNYKVILYRFFSIATWVLCVLSIVFSGFYILLDNFKLIQTSPIFNYSFLNISIFRYVLFILYYFLAVFWTNQLFNLVERNKQDISKEMLMTNFKKMFLIFSILLGFVVIIPLEEIANYIKMSSIVEVDVFGISIFWFFVYVAIAFVFYKVYHIIFFIIATKLQHWIELLVNHSILDKYLGKIKVIIEKYIPKFVHFVIDKKGLILTFLLLVLATIIIPLNTLLPYVLVAKLFVIISFIIDAFYDLAIDDIKLFLLSKNHILFKLLAQLTTKLKKPILWLLTSLGAFTLLLEKDFVTKAIIVISGYIIIIIAIKLIDWYAIQITKKYNLSDDANAINKDVDGFPVFTLIAKGIVITIIGLIILSSFNFNVSSIIAGLGVTGFAMALALQSLLSDVFASVAISMDKPFVIGDSITIDKLTGRVEKIGIKTTRVRTNQGKEVAVPNSKLTSYEVFNNTRMQNQIIHLGFNVSNTLNPEKLEMIPEIVETLINDLNTITFNKITIDRIYETSIMYVLFVNLIDNIGTDEALIKHQIFQGIHKCLYAHNIILLGNENDDSKEKTKPAIHTKGKGLGSMF